MPSTKVGRLMQQVLQLPWLKVYLSIVRQLCVFLTRWFKLSMNPNSSMVLGARVQTPPAPNPLLYTPIFKSLVFLGLGCAIAHARARKANDLLNAPNSHSAQRLDRLDIAICSLWWYTLRLIPVPRKLIYQ